MSCLQRALPVDRFLAPTPHPFFCPLFRVQFFSVIGLPLFQALHNVFPDTAPLVEQARANNAW